MGDDTTSGNSAKYASESYARSGKIMLSAIIILFGVVILIVCLHVYARWFLTRSRRSRRRRHRRTRIVFTTDLAPVVSRGLDPAVLKSLPTHLFSTAEHSEGLECAVCLSEFEENEKTRLLPKCNHSFHTECIDMWFYSHDTCPLCRVPVNSEPGQPVMETAVEIVVDSPRISPEIRPEDEMVSASSSNTGPSISVGSRRKVGISIEVPRRNESLKGVDEELHGSPGSQGLRTPGGRILSFKRILGREKRASTTPLNCSSSADPERGGGGEEAERERSES